MDTIESDAAELQPLMRENGGIYLVPSALPSGLMTRVRFAGTHLQDRGLATWRNASLLEQLRGFEPYVLCAIGSEGSRYRVTIPDGDPI